MQDLSTLFSHEHQTNALSRPVQAASSLPDPDLCSLMSTRESLLIGALPLRRAMNGVLQIATCGLTDADLRKLRLRFGPLDVWPVPRRTFEAAVIAQSGDELALAAENAVPAQLSCRNFNQITPKVWVCLSSICVLVLAAFLIMPAVAINGAICLALFSMLAAQILKVAAFVASKTDKDPSPVTQSPDAVLPLVTLLVPLFKEQDIANALLSRLKSLKYPHHRLEVLLILETNDAQTRSVLEGINLPKWIRVIDVPNGTVRTKPRAMNFAMNFAKGDIVGIYDAEDAPAPDQIDHVVTYFSQNPEVDCVQGILDYYNPTANWLSRCFTIEYAIWFRLLLPGLARLGLPIPLGGTTMFIRRHVLEAAHGWDAHNVTEDADLGLRLARQGYRTEVLRTVTQEEANNRPWPWIKQRSRWLKGYVITYLVHMRQPVLLWKNLGAWRFVGVQLVFLATILQFSLAPLLWSFWLVLLGMPHPFPTLMGDFMVWSVTCAFIASEMVALLVGWVALSRSPHHNLKIWVPTLMIYYPLGTLAMYKALWELLVNPFYWDKTMHGKSRPDLTAHKAKVRRLRKAA
jgi:cellulose synthase/poly-beta-1,6-N-acetylglucosamine synthase-like glycosyltransferase